MKKINILLLAVASLLFASCSSSKYYIDNPTTEEISVSIDGKEAIKVAPLEYKEISGVKPGEHTIKVNGGEELKLTIEEGSGLINATQAIYVISKEEYGSGVTTLKNNTISLGDYEYTGPFEVNDKLYINIDQIDLNVVENFPETVEVVAGKSRKVLTKIFRADDFIKYFDAQ